MRLPAVNRGVTAVLLALAAGGCAMGPELKVPITQNSSDRVAVRFTHAYQGKHGIEISGQVRRRNYSLVRGHIHVEALGQGDTLLAKADAYLPMMVRLRDRTAMFNTRLVVNDVAQVARLLVEVRSSPDA